jgi:hypothetical protein
MAMTERALVESANGEPLAEAIGGVVTVVLAILGLAHIVPNYLVPIAVIVFGAVLMTHGATLMSEYSQVARANAAVHVSGGVSAVFLAGAAGIVLGILALLGIEATALTAIAVIAYGAVLVLSANSSLHLHALRTIRTEGQPEMVGEDILTGSGGFLAMTGLSAVVLGILALAGFDPAILVLVSLLAMGATIVFTGTAFAGVMLTFFRAT